MPFSSAARAVVAALSAVGVVVALAGCDPVAWARRTPQDPVSASVSAGPSTVVPSAPVPVMRCPSGGDVAARIAALRATPSSRPTDRAAFDAAVGASGGQVVRLGATTLGFDDFRPNGTTLDGGEVDAPAEGLVGAGERRTVLQVAPHSSSRAASIPTTFPETNQLDVLKVSGTASVLQGFTVQGTDQGHLYNGLRVSRVDDLLASDIRVAAIPGDDSQPPGETFGINDFRTVGSRWSHITVDGAGVGGSGFATNSSRDVTICDTVSKGNRSAMGFAFWQTTNIRLVDCSAIDNGFSGFNFERVGGSVTLVRPTASGNRYGMRIASDQGSAKYTIIDPRLTDGHWTVTLPKRWYGTANRQKVSDITLIVHGRSRPDLLRIQTY